ncbi:MAG: gliding motility-associated C-terminal domain-containing protein, partial [Flavobacteriales bacterium]|nr:gliding motility-associated C-terminal domain-containing protein [Flavobacteriales bacterium]
SLTAGTYSLTVIINGCVSTDATIDITVNAQPSVPTIDGIISICEGDDIVLSTSSTCDSYLWIGPGGSSITTLLNPLLNTTANTTTIPSGDAAYAGGSWSLVCVSPDGCESDLSSPIDITINPIPVVTANNDGPICENGDVQLIGNTQAGATYQWYDEFYTTLLATTNDHTINGLTNGTYTFNYIVTSNGCADTASTVVTVSTVLAPPTIVANSTTLCEGDLLLLSTPTSADTYNWTGPNGFSSTSQVPTSIVANVTTAGTYNLDVVILGCGSATASTVITVNSLPAIPVLSVSSSVCQGDDLSLSTTATATNYYWIAPSGDTVITAVNNLTVPGGDINYGSGDWSLFVENANGCFSSNANPETITVNTLPVAIANNNGPICANADVTLTGNTQAGATYQWFDELYTTLLSTSTIHIETSLATGTYTFNYIVNSNGCVDTVSTIVIVNAVDPAPIVIADNSIVCEGDFFSLSTSTVADSYNWTGPNGYTATSATPVAIQGSSLTAGTYGLIVTTNGCSSTEGTIAIIVNAQPSAPSISGIISICEGDDIVLSTSSTCDSYLWIGPGGSSITTLLNPLLNTTANTTTIPSGDTAYASGSWSVVCVSPDGCESDLSIPINITINTPPDTAVANSNSPVCVGDDILLSSNSIPGATYEWSGTNGYFSSTQNPVITNAQLNNAATYSVTITLNGCSTSSVVPASVIVNAPPTVPNPTSNSPVCEGDTLWLISGTTASTHAWTGPGGFFSTQDTAFIANADSTNSGFYNLVITIGGCTSPVGQVEVDIIPTSYVPQIWATSDTICDGLILELQTDGFVGLNAEYIWYGPSGLLDTTSNPTYIDPNITVADSGEYFVQVLIGSCLSLPSQVALIDVNPIPATPDITFTSPICEGEVILLATSTLANGYDWVGPNGFNSDLQNPDAINPATLLDAGSYSLAVTIDGCQSADSVINITINPTPVTPIILSNSPICEGDSLIIYTTNSASEYLWTLPNLTTISQTEDSLIITPSVVADSGMYGLQLVEAGCPSETVFTDVMIQDLSSSQPFAGLDFVVCDGETVLNLSAENNGTGIWSTLSTVNIITPSNHQTLVTNLEQDSSYAFIWTLMNGVCGNIGSDTIDIYIAANPIANSDSLTISNGSEGLIEILLNDSIPLSVNYSLLDAPQYGTATVLNNGISYTTSSSQTSDAFIYELCLDACPSMCDTALVTIDIAPYLNAPDLITPNGDGTNDAFVIQGIENFPNNQLHIYNRWGNEIFYIENYQNDWTGEFNNKELPVGTYYYVFISQDTGELIMNGYITLQR